MLPSIGLILKELGVYGYSEDLYDYIDQLYFKRRYLVEIGIKKIISNLLDEEVRNSDVTIYITDAIPFLYGTY